MSDLLAACNERLGQIDELSLGTCTTLYKVPIHQPFYIPDEDGLITGYQWQMKWSRLLNRWIKVPLGVDSQLFENEEHILSMNMKVIVTTTL